MGRGRVSDREQAAFAAAVRGASRRLRVHCYRMTARSTTPRISSRRRSCARGARARASRAARSCRRGCIASRPTRASTRSRIAAAGAAAGRGAAVAPDDEPRSTPPLAPELPWLQPFPDRLLDPSRSRRVARIDRARVPRGAAAPAGAPARDPDPVRRAGLVGEGGRRAARAGVAAVTSALQRAHATMRTLAPTGRTEWAPLAPPTADERALLARYMAAWAQGDPGALTRDAARRRALGDAARGPVVRGTRDGRAAVHLVPDALSRRPSPRRDGGEPPARRSRLHAASRRLRVPALGNPRAARRGRPDRRDHDVLGRPVPRHSSYR